MKKFRLFFIGLVCCVLLAGCRTRTRVSVGGSYPSDRPAVAGHRSYGPPPHAPAHGYRHKHHQGVDLEFDSGLGVYVVVDVAGVYFRNSRYFRLVGGRWEIAGNHIGPWQIALTHEVPSKLTKSKVKARPGKGPVKKTLPPPGPGRGKGPSKPKKSGKR